MRKTNNWLLIQLSILVSKMSSIAVHIQSLFSNKLYWPVLKRRGQLLSGSTLDAHLKFSEFTISTCQFLNVPVIILGKRDYFKQNLNIDVRLYRKLPMVGIVVTISPNFNLYKMVVFPAASSPTEKKYNIVR